MSTNATDLVAAGERDTFLTKLAETIGATATAATVFGEPMINDHVVVVPVARVRWGCGGGGGQGSRKEAAEGQGFGGGGGMVASPVGFLIVREADVEYLDIERTRVTMAAALIGLALGVIFGWRRARR